jgi:hypothetical protein
MHYPHSSIYGQFNERTDANKIKKGKKINKAVKLALGDE